MTSALTMPGGQGSNAAMDWAFVERLRKFWTGKLIIKGIDSGDDAKLCIEHGIDAVLVSNHGGRSTETGRATIEALPEVVAAVGGRIPVFVDGGVRRGTDVFRPWRSAPAPWESADRFCGGSEPSAKGVSIACSKSCRAS